MTELDKSGCILVLCTLQYFEKRNSLKELFRAVCQRKYVLAMLEPDATQEGGLDQAAVEALIINKQLDKFKLRKKHKEWGDEGELLPAAFDHAPDEAEVRAALFATPPVEWNRLPHFRKQRGRTARCMRCLDEALRSFDRLRAPSQRT